MNKTDISHQQYHTSTVLKMLELSQQVNMGKVMFISINFFKNQTALVSYEKLANVMHEQKKGGFIQEVVFFPPPKEEKQKRTIFIQRHFTNLLTCWNIPGHKTDRQLGIQLISMETTVSKLEGFSTSLKIKLL